MSDLERRLRDLRESVSRYGQDHVFEFWGELDASGRAALLDQVAGIDFELIARLARQPLAAEAPGGGAALEPAPIIRLPRSESDRARAREAREAGEALLRRGGAAAFVVAGGQGSRLGFSGPKGAFPVGPVSRRSLFQLHAEKVLAAGRRYGAPVPFLVMTSETNHAETMRHFEKHGCFGLAREQVLFFPQAMLPAIDSSGRVFLERRDRIFTSPNGHGGSLKALFESGALDFLRRRGVEVISYFQVDNPLARVCDPVFLGYHAIEGAEMSTKVLPKTSWDERLGTIGLRDGRLAVIEYSDLPEAVARKALPDGSLEHWAGSIGIHAIAVPFVERLHRGGFQLPYHRAEKKIPAIALAGPRRGQAEASNGIKFETFVFDALALAVRSVTVEVRRHEEFSPIKNLEGRDSPATSRRDLTALYLEWLESAGARIDRGPGGEFHGAVEISPVAAIDADSLRGRLPAGTVVRDGFRLDA
jgi:UDP-N-acetylglucosamine/UDP-N-acetylgalactosamine diphosphorylase